MTEKEQLELKIELAHAYEHEAKKLVQGQKAADDQNKARRYLMLSQEMVNRLESEAGNLSSSGT